jgi:formate hydrogenlyase subunit 6/NADH:ubiquinone oxidoreductase subunit I
MARKLPPWQPSAEQRALWPAISGNTINGVGEASVRRPSPIYWHAPDATPHGPLQRWFYAQTSAAGPAVVEARAERQRAIDEPLAPLAEALVARDDWSAEVKRVARAEGADAVGIAAMRAEYVFEGLAVPPQRWMIVIAVGQDYAAMATAPSEGALVEVTRQYARGTRCAKRIAGWLRGQGHDAVPYGGPMAGSFILIPAAIAAGLGELGKHGSLIHPVLGSNFRLACVLTSAPLVADAPVRFGADDFCGKCKVCSEACPPDAIGAQKVIVRGETKWSVDFDRCLPYFNEHMGCAICLAVCPFSRPGMGTRLVEKLKEREVMLRERGTDTGH